MSWSDAHCISGADLALRAVVHHDLHAPRDHIAEVSRLATVCARDGLDVLGPPPAWLEDASSNGPTREPDDVRGALVDEWPRLVRSVQTLDLDTCHGVLLRRLAVTRHDLLPAATRQTPLRTCEIPRSHWGMVDTRGMPRRLPTFDRKRWTLLAVLGGTFMLLVDITIVQVALPSIQRELEVDFTEFRWIIDAYALSLATLILTFGSLADRFGRKRVFAAGVALFTLASLLCGLATSGVFLSVARGVQGVGGAAMFATSLALIAQEFSGRGRRIAIALWSATVGAAVAVGPLLGGALTDGLGWEWVFFVNLPIGIAALAITLLRTVNVRDPNAEHSDVLGLVTFSSALFLVIFALLRGNELGWSSPTVVGCFVGAALVTAAFIEIERRQRRPMLDLSLFRKPAFVGVSVGTFAMGAGIFGLTVYITVYLQGVLGYSPLEGGIRLLPFMIPTFLVPLVTPRLLGRLPPGLMIGSGLLLVMAGLLLMWGIDVESTWTTLLAGMILAGAGVGVANPGIVHVALGTVPPQRSGMAGGFSNTCRIGGLATGVAAFGALLEGQVWSRLHELVAEPPEGLASVIAAGGSEAVAASTSGDSSQLVAAAHAAYVSGLNAVLLAGAATLLVGGIAALALIRARDLRHTAAAAETA